MDVLAREARPGARATDARSKALIGVARDYTQLARFDPRLDRLPPAQRALWPRLADFPPDAVLYGGTAIAVRLAHRQLPEVVKLRLREEARTVDRVPLVAVRGSRVLPEVLR